MLKNIHEEEFLGGDHDVPSLLQMIRETSGSNDKIALIKEHSDVLRHILFACYNPYMKYGMSEEVLESYMESDYCPPACEVAGLDIAEFLNRLSVVNITNTIRSYVAWFIKSFDDDYQDVIKGILFKDLRLGINVKGINKAIPKLIPVFEVQGAHSFEKYPIKEGTWFSLSPKLNGVRGVIVGGKFLTKQGHEISGLDHIIKSIEDEYISKLRHFQLNDLVFDGELVYCLDDVVDDNDRFRKTTSIINSDSEVKLNVKFHIFALLNYEDFENGVSSYPHKDMTSMLGDIQRKICEVKDVPFECVPVLYEGTDQTQITKWLDHYDEMGLEGIMLNKENPYKCKKHTGILKVKKFYPIDLLITGFVEGKGKYKNSLGSIVVDYKGNDLEVGSGFTDEQRQEIWDNQETYLNRIAELSYKEESTNTKTGLNSLQFCTFRSIRELGKEVSYD